MYHNQLAEYPTEIQTNTVVHSPKQGWRKPQRQPTKVQLGHFLPNLPSTEYAQRNPRVYDEPRKITQRAKTQARAHNNTLKRRERRKRNLQVRFGTPTEIDHSDNNRFALLEGLSNDKELESNEERQPEGHQQQGQEDPQRHPRQKKKQKRKQTQGPQNQGHVKQGQNNNNSPKSPNDLSLQDTPLVTENDNENETGENQAQDKRSKGNKKKLTFKTYLQDFRILSWLKEKINSDEKIRLDIQNFSNEVFNFATQTAHVYDRWVRSHYEVQVWQEYANLSRDKGHWAKEIVALTGTRNPVKNEEICTHRLAQHNGTCISENATIAINLRKLSASEVVQPSPNLTNRAHDLMLDYIKEATSHVAKLSTNRIRQARAEEAEWAALKTFENAASEQQKIYASMFCKPVLKVLHNKLKRQEGAAAHVSLQIIPKTLPQVDFSLRMDESVLSTEQRQLNHNRMDQLIREYQLGATQLYLKVAKEEFEGYEERMKKILDDFPKDISVTNVDDRDGTSANDLQQTVTRLQAARSATTAANKIQSPVLPNEARQQGQNNKSLPATRLYTEYMKASRKRVMFEAEKDVLFLAERRVEETPFVASPAEFVNPPLRKDFTLQT